MHNKLIGSIAFLVAHNEQGSLIESTFPIIEYIIKKNDLTDVSVKDMHSLLLSDLHINLPIHVIEYILEHYMKHGYITVKDSHYIINHMILPQRDIVTEIDSNILKYQDLINDLMLQFNDYLNTMMLDVGKADFDDFQSILIRNIACMYKKSLGTESASLKSLPDSGCAEELWDFAFSKFIRNKYKDDSSIFSTYIDLCFGFFQSEILASSLIDKPKRDGNFHYFLDTSIVLDLLGCHGTLYEQSSKWCISSVIQLGGSVSVFNQTLNEVDSILKRCVNYWYNGDPGFSPRAWRVMKAEKRTREWVIILRASVRSKLEDIGATLEFLPNISERRASNITNKLSNLRDKWGLPSDESTLMHDVKSVLAMNTLRKENRTEKYVFLTDSVSLLEALKQSDLSGSHTTPLCSSINLVCTTMWLTSSADFAKTTRLNAVAISASIQPYNKPLFDAFRKALKELSEKKGLESDLYHALLMNDSLYEMVEIASCGKADNMSREAMESAYNRLLAESNKETLAQIKVLSSEKEDLRSSVQKDVDDITDALSELSESDRLIHQRIQKIAICGRNIIGALYTLLCFTLAFYISDILKMIIHCPKIITIMVFAFIGILPYILKGAPRKLYVVLQNILIRSNRKLVHNDENREKLSTRLNEKTTLLK